MFEIGAMFWAGRDPAETLRELTDLGIHCGQLGIPGDFNPDFPNTWRVQNFRIHTVFAAFHGEDYADIPTVERTVGFVPPATRTERETRMMAVSDFAHAIGVTSIATHIGCVHAGDVEMRDLVRRVCDRAASNGQTFALETGQETAEVLLDFIREVDRPNLGINFDPANMVLYGSGDPIEALSTLGTHVLSVHCKDGDPPRAPGALGVEKPLGKGAVDFGAFIQELDRIGYRGPLFIERESSDPPQRLKDIEAGIRLLRTLIPTR